MAAKLDRTFYEFFAGGGMARAGLGNGWGCLFANDFDHKKCQTYNNNWGESEIHHGDIKALVSTDLPSQPDLVWASFPCQDLSLAGGGAGLKGERSGTFWPFWDLIKQLSKEDRKPDMVVLENVCGTLTSHGGKDFSAICNALYEEQYYFGAIIIDAARFVPQSRPRLFIVAVDKNVALSEQLISSRSSKEWHTRTLINAHAKLSNKVKKNWLWWNIPIPKQINTQLIELIEDDPHSTRWHTPEETKQLLAMMSKVNKDKVKVAQKEGSKLVGTIYKRTRKDESGNKVQRAEVRFDNLAGCLRTPAGGSSRQLIIVIEGEKIRSRLMSTRETARLMGLPDSYILPNNYNEAYHLTGDGVVVPVVRHIAQNILEPIIMLNKKSERVAA